MKYRKKLLIDAEQFDGTRECASRLGVDCDDAGYFVATLEGPLRVTIGDWIATGIKGEHWAIKPDIFAATYELVEQSAEAGMRFGIFEEVHKERAAQDLQWGGPMHDDSHSIEDWVGYIIKHASEATHEGTRLRDFRRSMVRVASLAVAAIEACDRATARILSPLPAREGEG